MRNRGNPAFLDICLMLLGCSIGIYLHMSAPCLHIKLAFAAPPHNKHATPITPQSLCQNPHPGDLHEAFRELDCLVTIRKNIHVLHHSLDRILYQKYNQLHNQLRQAQTDSSTLAQWQTLYVLGARLYSLQNQRAERAEVPVYQVNSHHMSVSYWIKEAMRRNMGPLFHLDTHDDMHSIERYRDVRQALQDLKQNRNVRQAWHAIAHSIDDCAQPVTGAVLSGFYSRVIWGKPSWNPVPNFLNRSFFYGVNRPLMCIALETPISMVAPDAFQLYYDPQAEPNKKPLQDSKVWIRLTSDLKPINTHFTSTQPFKFSVITTDLPIDQNGHGKGQKSLQRLLQALPQGPFTLDLDLDYFASIDYAKPFKRSILSRPRWLHWEEFTRQRQLLQQRLESFQHMLEFLKKKKRLPTVITVADSTFVPFAYDKSLQGQSEYTPIEHAAYIRHEVHRIFRQVYGQRIEAKTKTP